MLNFCTLLIFLHVTLFTTHEAAWYIFSVVSACLSDNNFRKLWHRKFIFAHPVYRELRVRFVYEGHRIKFKVTGAKKVEFLFPQCKTSIGNNSGSINHRAVNFSFAMGSSTTADRMVWPQSSSRDQKWPRLTKYTACAEYCQRRCTNTYHWSGRNERATENGVGQAGQSHGDAKYLCSMLQITSNLSVDHVVKPAAHVE